MDQPRTPQKELLQRMRTRLVQCIDFETSMLLDEIYAKSVINDAVRIKVKGKDQYQQNRIVLDYLEMQPADTVELFLQLLKKEYCHLHDEARVVGKYGLRLIPSVQ